MLNIKKSKIKSLACLLLAPLLFTACSSGGKTKDVQGKVGSDYPNKPITMIVPYSAGGSSDIGTRMMAKRLEKELGQTIVVENYSGAGGYVGWNKLLKAKPDGYTLSMMALPYISGYLNPDNKKDVSLDDITPLVNHVWDTTAWAVNKDSKFKDLNSLLEYVKSHPGEVKVGTSGAYTQHHIALIELEKLGYKMEAVHTGGLSDSISMALGGHIDVVSMGAGDVKKQVDEGAMIPLAVLDNEKSEYLPDVPTFKEASGLDIKAYAARGYAGPKGMPEDIVKKLDDAFEKIINDPEHVKEMKDLGLSVKYMDHEEYINFLKDVEKQYKETLGW
ncbi:tripartite tricarboxylate transporter substrate binding protein [Peptoniphilus sp. SGI.035]|uniref:tripartite tricarboxylate transporter substrate binding protein n=1 Tax=Peptoniphilus sp. SGI.035 TaxID=3420564 RepID=UPI003D03A1B5